MGHKIPGGRGASMGRADILVGKRFRKGVSNEGSTPGNKGNPGMLCRTGLTPFEFPNF